MRYDQSVDFGIKMSLLQDIAKPHTKKKLPEIRPGDTIRVHQKIREGNKERVQVFEGLVMRRGSGDGVAAAVTVRRIASGVGVERTFLLHSPKIVRIDVIKRAKVRRAWLGYMRERTGKRARLVGQRFERVEMNMVEEAPEEEVPTDAPKASDMPAEETEETEVEQIGDVSTEELASDENKEAHQDGDDKHPDENDLKRREAEMGEAEADDEKQSPAEAVEESDKQRRSDEPTPGKETPKTEEKPEENPVNEND
jgi:large subunit ribosomal protein L19